MKKFQLLSDLRCYWYDIIVLNVHASTENKDDGISKRLYEELQHVCNLFPKYHIKILLGDSNAKVGRGDTFKPTIWNGSLHETMG